jgi:Zn-finger nucleic acid-binding protein
VGALGPLDRWRTRTVEVMQCPHDQTVLQMTERQGIEIDYCPTCRGVWLDRGELDKIIERASAPPPSKAPAASPGRIRARRWPATLLHIPRQRPTRSTRSIRTPGVHPGARTARTTTTAAGTTPATKTRRSASLSSATCSTSDRLPEHGERSAFWRPPTLSEGSHSGLLPGVQGELRG